MANGRDADADRADPSDERDRDRTTREEGTRTDHPVPDEPLPFSQVVGRVALGIIALLFLIFAFFNLQPVDFNWIFGETEVVTQGGERVRGGVPLIVLLIGSFVLGGLVGAGAFWRRERKRKARWERRQAGHDR
ncbi:MAG: hypothetical protein KY437_05620 [Actinobacteria bacterium]|nr:hypothetical protein [Actinomycetota bacterium]